MNENVEFDKGYYLCEGIYLYTEDKKLKDLHNDRILSITKIDDKITIFEREVNEWIIYPSVMLILDDKEKEYLPFKNALYILFGAFSYIEKIERYYQGEPFKDRASFLGTEKAPTELLIDGIRRNFSNLSIDDTILKNIIEKTRHRMMHTGTVGDRVLLNYDRNKFSEPIEYNTTEDSININPVLLLKRITDSFADYIKELRTGSNNSRITKFKKTFDDVYADEISILTA